MSNPYMQMPIQRVRSDAITGVSLARAALRQRDPGLARTLGIGIDPPTQAKGTRTVGGDKRSGGTVVLPPKSDIPREKTVGRGKTTTPAENKNNEASRPPMKGAKNEQTTY